MFNTVHSVDLLLIYWYVHLFPIYHLCNELRHLCPSPAFTIDTPSTESAPAQRRGWKIGS